MKQNVAGQKILFSVTSLYSGELVSTDVSAGLSVQIIIDGAKAIAGTGVFTECKSSANASMGQFCYTPVTAETNGDAIKFIFGSTDADHVIASQLFETDAAYAELLTAQAELTADPGATPTLKQQINALYFALRNINKHNRSTGEQVFYAEDGTTPIIEMNHDDDGSIFTKGKLTNYSV